MSVRSLPPSVGPAPAGAEAGSACSKAAPGDFEAILHLKAARLVEILPAAPGEEAAALGFALAWAAASAPDRLLFWAVPDHGLSETGAPCAEGFAHYGLSLERVMIARTRCQADALWAAEQALTLPKACVLVTVAASPRALSLTATRRLLLAAEKHQSRCVLLRFDRAAASAAWLRWSIAAAPSEADARELGGPAFQARLARHRAGPTGQSWRLDWNAHDHAFRARPAAALAGDLAAAARDGSFAARRAAAG